MDEEVQKDIIINVETNYDDALAQLVKYISIQALYDYK